MFAPHPQNNCIFALTLAVSHGHFISTLLYYKSVNIIQGVISTCHLTDKTHGIPQIIIRGQG